MNSIATSIMWIEEWSFVFKILSAGLSIIFFFFAVRYMIRMDYFSPYRKYKHDIYKYGGSYLQRVPDDWKKILSYITTDDAEKWKQALLKADAMLLEVLKTSGHSGISMDERLFAASRVQVPHVLELQKARQAIFFKLDQGEDLSLKEVKEILQLYRDILRGFGVLE